MTRGEAIQVLQEKIDDSPLFKDEREAFELAIEALHREEAEEKGYCHRINYTPKPCENANCDCVEVVRCKDCRQYIPYDLTEAYGWCCKYKAIVEEDDYCSHGERQCNYFGKRQEP